MTLRGVIVLGAVAALLAAIVLFGDRGRDHKAPAGAGARLVPAFDRASVRRITIARAGQPPFALVGGAGGAGVCLPGTSWLTTRRWRI